MTMNKRKALILTATLFAAALITVIALPGANENMPAAKKYRDMSEEQVLESFNRLEQYKLAKETESVFSELSKVGIDALIPFAASISRRINEFPENVLVALIADKNNDLFFRATIVQLYSGNNGRKYKNRSSTGNNEIRNLLLDDKIESYLKEVIIIELDFSDEKGLGMLESIALGGNEMMAFQALKKLHSSNKVKAAEISNKLLSNYKNEDIEKVNAALYVMSEEYRVMRIQKTFNEELQQRKKDFIDICVEIINTTKEEDKLNGRAYSSLSDMNDHDAITAIIKNKNIDRSSKGSAIGANYSTLLEMAKNKSSEDEIGTVCEAMGIYPLNGIAEALSESKPKIVSKQLIEKIDFAIKLIEKEGEDPNPKYIQLYNEVN